MGTSIQEVYDSFFMKLPEDDFTGRETLVLQLFKASVAYSYKTVPENLTYTYDEILHEGSFVDTIGQDSIELIALFMTREFYRREKDRYSKIKQHVGTQSFNKLPDMLEKSKDARTNYVLLSDEIEKFRQEFYYPAED